MKNIYLLMVLFIPAQLIQAQGSAENDLTLSDVSYANYQPGIDTNYRNLEYSIYQSNQLRPFTFRGIATNSGSNTQTGVQLKVTISNNWSYSETLYSDTFSLAPAMEQEIYIEDYTPPNQLGDYSISYELMSDAQDENLIDNFGEKSFEISEMEFARDRGVSEGGYPDFIEGGEIGSFFHIEESVTVNCIYVALSDLSDELIFTEANLLDKDFNFLSETETVIIQNSDLNSVGGGNFIPICLYSSFFLQSDQDYFVTIIDLGGSNEFVVAVEDEVEPNSAFFRDWTQGSTEWFPMDVKPMIRMGLSQQCLLDAGCISSIESKVQVDASNLYPNPATDQLKLEYTLLEATQLEITIADIHGKTVYRESTGKLTVGEHRSTFDVQHLPAGVYALNIYIDGEVISNKFMVER